MSDEPLIPMKPARIPRVPLRTHDSARRTLASFIRAYRRGELDKDLYRGLVYGMSALLGYFKLESDLRIEERLDAVEAAIAEAKK
jgi:hypothetical protein